MTENRLSKQGKDTHKNMRYRTAAAEADAFFAQAPYPKQIIRYTQDDKNYCAVRHYDFGSYWQEESQLTDSDRGRLVNLKTPDEAISYILWGILDDDEGIISPKGMNLGRDFRHMLEENKAEIFERQLMRHTYRILTGETVNPLDRLDQNTADACNKMLEKFSYVTVDKDFPAAIISAQKLTVSASGPIQA